MIRQSCGAIFLAILFLIATAISPCLAVSANAEGSRASASGESDDDGHSFLVGALLYIPNRVLDVFDIFRFRARVGPGFSAGIRATKVASAYVGTYATVYGGLPGPRLRQFPKLPVGLESHSGVTASIADATVDGGIGPDYSSSEFGVSLHLGIIGFDIGVDPVEAADLVTGVATIDIRDDEL